jgi:hypothetical protein
MAETAAHLTDQVLPRLPVRQWVLSVPKLLRYFMQRDGPVLGMVLGIFLRVIAQTLQANSPGAQNPDKAALHIGAVAGRANQHGRRRGRTWGRQPTVKPGRDGPTGAAQAPSA